MFKTIKAQFEVGDHVPTDLLDVKDKGIGPSATGQHVCAATAFWNVVAKPALQNILSLTTKEFVVTAIARHYVLAGFTKRTIPALTTCQTIIPALAKHDIPTNAQIMDVGAICDRTLVIFGHCEVVGTA